MLPRKSCNPRFSIVVDRSAGEVKYLIQSVGVMGIEQVGYSRIDGADITAIELDLVARREDHLAQSSRDLKLLL